MLTTKKPPNNVFGGFEYQLRSSLYAISICSAQA
jgi:hypothetical protein